MSAIPEVDRTCPQHGPPRKCVAVYAGGFFCSARLKRRADRLPSPSRVLAHMKSARVAPRPGREPVTGASSVAHHGHGRLLPRGVRE